MFSMLDEAFFFLAPKSVFLPTQSSKQKFLLYVRDDARCVCVCVYIIKI